MRTQPIEIEEASSPTLKGSDKASQCQTDIAHYHHERS